jgi:tetratricopeptide (TPR) repeat protein
MMNEIELTLQEGHYRAARALKMGRKDETEWKSLDSLTTMIEQEFPQWVKAEAYDQALELVDLIDKPYLSVWGHYRTVLILRLELIGKLNSAKDEWSNCNRIARLNHNLALYESAMTFHRKALEFSEKISDESTRNVSSGMQIGDRGRTLFALGRYEDAISDFQDALSTAVGQNNRFGIIVQLSNLGRAWAELGDFPYAIKRFEEALDRLKTMEKQQNKSDAVAYWIRVVSKDLGDSYQSLGFYKKAEQYYKDAFQSVQKNLKTEDNDSVEDEDRRGQSIQLNITGRLFLDHGIYAEAQKAFTDALEVDKKIESASGQMHSLEGLVATKIAVGKYDEAIGYATKALEIAYAVNSKWHLQHICTLLGQIHIADRDFEAAFEALTQAEKHNIPRFTHRTFLLQGIAMMSQNKKDAKDYFDLTLNEVAHLLGKSPEFYHAHYSKVLALVGKSLASGATRDNAFITEIFENADLAYKSNRAKGIVNNVVTLLRYFQTHDNTGLVEELIKRFTQ